MEIPRWKRNQLFKEPVDKRFGVDMMFNYVGDISNLAHEIIKKYLKCFDTAVDATLGNGHDTDFLAKHFKRVYSFDIQQAAIEKYKTASPENVTLINKSHENLKEHILERPDCIMYNLGFLPGGDKSITTTSSSSLKSLQEAAEIISEGGLICIAIYTGHHEGKLERDAILNFAETLPKRQFGVMLHSFINRANSPMLLIIERNSIYLKNEGDKN
jgi:hypothetical protein